MTTSEGKVLTLQFPTVIRLEPHMIVQLPEYSTTLPTGVYPGKMWRRESKGVDGISGVEVPGLKGKWIIGSYMPLSEQQCHLKWFPLEVVQYNDSDKKITEHCYDEECLYLSLFGPNIDDVHHSPNCRGALIRRAGKAEHELAQLVKAVQDVVGGITIDDNQQFEIMGDHFALRVMDARLAIASANKLLKEARR